MPSFTAMDWQLIDTAPADTPVLTYHPSWDTAQVAIHD
jgi:hypothetical protein